MQWLIQGDVLPVVSSTQILLRRHRPQSLINTDGNFGSKTAAAVQAFQGHHSLGKDAIIGEKTWGALTTVSGLQTIDVVDGTDPSLIALEVTDIRKGGGDPIVMFGMSNGIAVMMQEIRRRARNGNVMLLRIHGHGNNGLQNVSGGEINGAPHLAAISNSNFHQIESHLQSIRQIFVGFGSVQLLGCDVGGGTGNQLIQRLAMTWGVPVTAGVHTQFGGGKKTFRFEGQTVTGFPGGHTLKTWSSDVQARFGNQSAAA